MYNCRYAEDFHWCICLIQDIYKEQVATKCRDRLVYFHKFALFTEIFFKATFASFLIAIFAFLLYPIYMYFMHDEIVPILPIYLPLIDASTVIGYTMMSLYHLIMFTLATTGFGALEFLLAIVIVNTLIFAKLISWDLQQMNVELQEGESRTLTVKLHFKNVLLMHQEMDQYLKRIYRISFKTFFVQIGTTSCGAIFALYALLAVSSCLLLFRVKFSSNKYSFSSCRCIIYQLMVQYFYRCFKYALLVCLDIALS